MLTYKNFQRLRLFQPNMSLLSRVLGVLVCLCAHVLWCAYVVTCLHTRMLGMSTWLEYLRAFVFGVFTCLYVYVCQLVLCPYVLTSFTCLLAQISYMLTCLRAFLTSFVLFSLHLKSWLPKILIYKFFFYSKKYLEPIWTSMKEFFAKKN